MHETGSLGHGSRVLWLSWDVGAADGGLSHQAALLAGGLRRRGVEVLVVTREAGRPHRPVDADRVVLTDPPPTMQGEVRGRFPEALAFANRVIARLVAEARPGDVAVVDGWQPALAGLPAAEVEDLPVVALLDGLEAIRRRFGDQPDADGGSVQDVERLLAAMAQRVLWRGPAPVDTVAAVLQVGVDVVATLPLAAELPDRPVRRRPHGPWLVAVLPPRGAGVAWSRELSAGLPAPVVRDLRLHDWPGDPGRDRPPDVVVVHDVERGDVVVHAMAVGIPVVVGEIGGLARLVAEADTGRVTGPAAGATARVVADLLDDPSLRAGLATRARRHVRLRHSVDHAVDRLLDTVAEATAR